MTQTISRLYGAAHDATACLADLKEHGFGQGEVYAVSPPPPGQNDLSTLAAAIAQGNVLKAKAAIYAQGVAKGGTLITVHAPFGAAAKATAILDRHNPIDSGVSDPAYPRITYDDAAPFSSSLQIPALLSDPAPLSSFWNMPVLTEGAAPLSDAFAMPTQSSNPAPLSSAIGWSTLLRNPAPLSSLFKIPVLRS